jgi:hypothetical protein
VSSGSITTILGGQRPLQKVRDIGTSARVIWVGTPHLPTTFIVWIGRADVGVGNMDHRPSVP